MYTPLQGCLDSIIVIRNVPSSDKGIQIVYSWQVFKLFQPLEWIESITSLYSLTGALRQKGVKIKPENK